MHVVDRTAARMRLNAARDSAAIRSAVSVRMELIRLQPLPGFKMPEKKRIPSAMDSAFMTS
jgi:hypothetical protein